MLLKTAVLTIHFLNCSVLRTITDKDLCVKLDCIYRSLSETDELRIVTPTCASRRIRERPDDAIACFLRISCGDTVNVKIYLMLKYTYMLIKNNFFFLKWNI